MATIKQKIAFNAVLKNKGNVSAGMREANYSVSAQHKPKCLTGSQGWKELLDEYMPEKKIAEYHDKLLEKKETLIVYDKKRKAKLVKTKEIDPNSVKAALDMYYKLSGKYSAERHIVNDFADMTDEELEEELKQAMAQKKRYDDAVPTKS